MLQLTLQWHTSYFIPRSATPTLQMRIPRLNQTLIYPNHRKKKKKTFRFALPSSRAKHSGVWEQDSDPSTQTSPAKLCWRTQEGRSQVPCKERPPRWIWVGGWLTNPAAPPQPSVSPCGRGRGRIARDQGSCWARPQGWGWEWSRAGAPRPGSPAFSRRRLESEPGAAPPPRRRC